MAFQLSDSLRNAMAAAYETAVGTDAVLKLYDLTAGAPANCAAAITATVLATITLPTDWMAAGSAGQIVKSGTWQDTADAAGTCDFYRLFASNGTTCHEQGTVTITAGGGDLTLDNPVIEIGQTVTITGWTRTVGGA